MVEPAENAKEELRSCPTCEQEISAGKFRLHEVQCARNNFKCQECGEIVAKADRESHEAEAHTEVRNLVKFSDGFD